MLFHHNYWIPKPPRKYLINSTWQVGIITVLVLACNVYVHIVVGTSTSYYNEIGAEKHPFPIVNIQ